MSVHSPDPGMLEQRLPHADPHAFLDAPDQLEVPAGQEHDGRAVLEVPHFVASLKHGGTGQAGRPVVPLIEEDVDEIESNARDEDRADGDERDRFSVVQGRGNDGAFVLAED
jgi:hypothetical protein